MRNYLKFLATAMIAAILVCAISLTSFAAVTPFKDVDDKKNETLAEAVELLVKLGVTKGVSETEFGTMQHVTRQQMAAFVYRLMKNGKSLEGVTTNSTPFTDLTDSTYYGYISWASGNGVIKGTSATTFNPKGGIILQDAYTMVIRALGHEDDTYQYPYTYIDKAEELGLDEGLDSVVGYSTKLTRGDVAVILRNAFYAETAKEVVSHTERYVGDEVDGRWVVAETKRNATLAEDVYDVEIGTYTVRATPKYAFNDSIDSTEYAPLCDEYDKDMIYLVATDEKEELSEIICEFEATGLSGKADDYIMQSVNVFYSYDVKNNKNVLDEVYFVSGSKTMLESTSGVSAFDRADTKSSLKDEDFFKRFDSGNRIVEKPEGYLMVGNETIYFFDAPYTYLKPDYNSIKGDYTDDELDALREDMRNEKNCKLINIKCLDAEKGTYSYYVEDDEKQADKPEQFIVTFKKIYSKGVYTMRFYDVDADGIYEYAHYMPATYGFMDGDDDVDFNSVMDGNKPRRETNKGASDLDLSFVPTIYYNNANITGKSFNDGDLVFAYLNPEANMIHVMNVVTPYTGYVNYIRPEHGIFRIDGTTFQTAYSYRIVHELYDGDDARYNRFNYLNEAVPEGGYYLYYYNYSDAKTFPKLMPDNTSFDTRQSAVGEILKVYAFKPAFIGTPQVIYYEHVEDSTVAFGMDELAIPVSDPKNTEEAFTESKFDPNSGEMVYHAKVYLGGKEKYVPLNVFEMYPALDSSYADGQYNLAAVKDGDGNTAYVNKISKFTVDSDGLYTIVPLLHAEDEDGEYIGINKDSTTLVDEDNSQQYGNDLGYNSVGFIKKISGSRYQLVDEYGDTLLGDFTSADGRTVQYMTMLPSTRIIIKNKISESKDEYEYLEFDSTTFAGTSETALTNIQYILKGNPDSKTRADLVLLYAEAVEFEFEKKGIENGWRIVAATDITKDEEGDFRNGYKLFNPYTGAIEEDVFGESAEEKTSNLEDAAEIGSIVELKGGYVDEDGKVLGNIDTSVSAGLVWLTEYDAEGSYVGFVPVEATENAIDDGTIECKSDFVAFVEDYVYNGVELNFDDEEFRTRVDENDDSIYGAALYYEITEDTVVSVLKSDKPGVKGYDEAEFASVGVEAIEKASKEYRCYNNDVLDKKENYSTVHADYIKAYVYAEEAEDEESLPVAQYIIIVVNGEEETIFSDYDANFLPKN